MKSRKNVFKSNVDFACSFMLTVSEFFDINRFREKDISRKKIREYCEFAILFIIEKTVGNLIFSNLYAQQCALNMYYECLTHLNWS